MTKHDDHHEPRRPGPIRRSGNWLVARFMPADQTELERQTWLQRLVNSLVIYLCGVLLVWIATTLVSVPRMADKIESMSIKIDGTYRADVARRDFDDITRRLDAGDAADRRHDLALDGVRGRVDRIEYIIEREHRIDLRRETPAASAAPRAPKVKP